MVVEEGNSSWGEGELCLFLGGREARARVSFVVHLSINVDVFLANAVLLRIEPPVSVYLETFVTFGYLCWQFGDDIIFPMVHIVPVAVVESPISVSGH